MVLGTWSYSKKYKRVGKQIRQHVCKAFLPSAFLVIKRLFKEILRLDEIQGNCDEDKMEKFIEKLLNLRVMLRAFNLLWT